MEWDEGTQVASETEPAPETAVDGLAIRLHDGAFALTGTGLLRIDIEALAPALRYIRRDHEVDWHVDLVETSDGFRSTPGDHGLALHLRTEPRGAAHVVHATLRNEGSLPVELDRVSLLSLRRGARCEIGSGTDRWSVFRQGYQSWTGTRSFRVGEADPDPISMLLQVGLIDVARPSPAHRGHFRSDQFAAIKNQRSGEALVIGILDTRAMFGDVEVAASVRRCTRLDAGVDLDGLSLAPGAETALPPLWIAAGFDEHELLAAYADAVGEQMRARIPARNPVGWCSWYYYFTRISEECIVENVGALQRLRDRFPCDYVQVDDGYQSAIGDWLTPNASFPRGMAWVAEQIRGAGFEAGIWTAPFIARPDSRLYRDHPDWFVRHGGGGRRFALWNPMWGARGCYALDTTNPAVLDWLRETFRVIRSEWGYRILKLDFLFAAALPGLRFDETATRAAALRRGLDAIREGAGDDAFLLGCGCPLGPAIGVVDAMRIGPDVAPFWDNFLSRVGQRDLHGLATKHAIRNTLARAFLHRRWWLNDPDCLMVRDEKTKLTKDEVQSLAAVIGATDGMIVVSDRMDRLSTASLDMLERTLRLAERTPGVVARADYANPVRVADLMQSDMPSIVVRRGQHQTAVAVFNFSPTSRRFTVELSAHVPEAAQITHARELWTDREIAVVDGVADLGDVPAHGCRVLSF